MSAVPSHGPWMSGCRGAFLIDTMGLLHHWETDRDGRPSNEEVRAQLGVDVLMAGEIDPSGDAWHTQRDASAGPMVVAHAFASAPMLTHRGRRLADLPEHDWGRGIRAARAALAAAQTARANGERPPITLTFKEAAEAWYDARSGAWRPRTVATYRGHLDNHLLPAFGNRRLAAITANDIAKYVSEKRGTLKGWTLKGHLGVLGGIFRHAMRHLGLRGSNPVTLLDRHERPSTEDEKEHRILALDDLAALLEAVEDDYRLIFRFASETGARLGEVLGLVWGDLDLDGQAVTITYQLDQKGRRVYLKTPRSRRTIEIWPDLVTELRKHRLAAPASRSSDHDYVS